MIHRIEHNIFSPQWNLLVAIGIEREACQSELLSYPRAQEFYVESVFSMN